EIIHLVEVLTPLAVHDLEDHAALDLTHGFFAQLLLTCLIGRSGVLDDMVGDELGGQRVEATVLVDELVDTEADRVDLPEGTPELVQVPLGGIAARGLLADVAPQDLFEHVHHLLTQVLALEHLVPLGVDDLALLVEDLVVLEDVLADLEVLRLDLTLGGSDRLADHAGLDRLVVRDAQLIHERLEARAGAQAQQVVLQAPVEAGHARVSLTPRTSTQLVVDTAGLVAFGTEHIQTAHLDDLLVLFLVVLGGLFQRFGPGLLVLLGGLERAQATGLEFLVGDELGVASEHDVGTTAGHVGGDGDRTELAGPGDDRCLTGVILGVEDLVLDALAFEHVREQFGLLHAGRTDQDGLTELVAFGDVLGDRLELGVLVLVDDVLDVLTDHRLVGGDGYHTDVVGLVELRRLGLGRTGHPGELLVETEVVLERDLGQGLVLVLDLDAFLGLDGLVHTLVVAASRQDTAGELVDDEDLTVLDDVFLVLAVELFGLQGVVEETDERGVHRLVEVVDTQPVL